MSNNKLVMGVLMGVRSAGKADPHSRSGRYSHIAPSTSGEAGLFLAIPSCLHSAVNFELCLEHRNLGIETTSEPPCAVISEFSFFVCTCTNLTLRTCLLSST